jgi:hypothetical protein
MNLEIKKRHLQDQKKFKTNKLITWSWKMLKWIKIYKYGLNHFLIDLNIWHDVLLNDSSCCH